MVAPSFQSFIKLSDPFSKNGKTYIEVQNPKTQTIRQVRWYTEMEYDRAYGKTHPRPIDYDRIKKIRGFSEGFIHLIGNNREEDEEDLLASVARYATDFGWHIVSTDPIPTSLPPHLTYTKYLWEDYLKELTKNN